ncbi:MAG: helix-turn-helix transcriptional regulator [Victivallales bacterium]|nr:helix-turn-helix transcriptional regulator [Victivallales bacterium]
MGTVFFEQLPPTMFRESLWILPPHLQYDLPFSLYSTGITLRDPNYHITRSIGAPYYVLECILDGEGFLNVAGHGFRPKAGDVYLLPKEIPNEYYTSKKAPWEKIWFNISGPLIDSLIACYHLDGIVYVQNTNMQPLFRQGMELIAQCSPDTPVEFATHLTRIFATLASLRRRTAENSFSRLPARQMKNWLDEHWRVPYSLPKLSAACGKSPAQTMRIFKAAWRCTPKEYHTRIRFSTAERYLENTNEQIKVIADWLGFANEFQFSAWFKKQAGVSPMHFRMKMAHAVETAGSPAP